MTELYPFNNHPCWSSNRRDILPRIHLPVASKCNVKCFFCDLSVGSSCHTSKPGYAHKVMNPESAAIRAIDELTNRNGSLLIAVSGPGEPLANEATFHTLKRIRESFPDCDFCISTNGVLLADMVPVLNELHVRTISVSMSALDPLIVSNIYEWAEIDNKQISSREMGIQVVKKQLNGIDSAVNSGIFVKVNSILIPGLNDIEIPRVAEAVSGIGAKLQNVVPLIPCGKMSDSSRPSQDEVHYIRGLCSTYIPQFYHCSQCRSDVIGRPGADTEL